MKERFDAVIKRLIDGLGEEGYELRSQNESGGDFAAVIANSENVARIEFSRKNKMFYLYRGTVEDQQKDFVRSQSYLFDPEQDGLRETNGVANEFIDTMCKKQPRTAAAAQRRRRDADSDESSAVFFVNRIPTVMPECREPLLRHKAHYGQLLPRWFCEEVVVTAMNDMLRDGTDKDKCRAFFELLSNMYTHGDLDTKSIIVQVLLASISSQRDIEYVQTLVSPDLKKAWNAGKKWFGKNVKPEKRSRLAEMAAQYQGDQLAGGR